MYAPNLDATDGLADWKIWLTSLDRIQALSPQAIVCGHGPVVRGENVAQAIERVREALYQRVAETLAITTAEPDDIDS